MTGQGRGAATATVSADPMADDFFAVTQAVLGVFPVTLSGGDLVIDPLAFPTPSRTVIGQAGRSAHTAGGVR